MLCPSVSSSGVGCYTRPMVVMVVAIPIVVTAVVCVHHSLVEEEMNLCHLGQLEDKMNERTMGVPWTMVSMVAIPVAVTVLVSVHRSLVEEGINLSRSGQLEDKTNKRMMGIP